MWLNKDTLETTKTSKLQNFKMKKFKKFEKFEVLSYNIYIKLRKRGKWNMIDYFTTQIQFDELAEIQNWNDAMEDPRYFYEE